MLGLWTACHHMCLTRVDRLLLTAACLHGAALACTTPHLHAAGGTSFLLSLHVVPLTDIAPTALPPLTLLLALLPTVLLQGHLYHWLQPGGCCHPGAAHYVQEPHQVID